MYTPTQLLKAIRNPQKAILELNRLYNRKLRGKKGIDIMAADWDTILILDACRYDIFEEINTIEGDLTAVVSSDSSTSGFLTSNFAGDAFGDTVYISANPQVQRHKVEKCFHDTIRLWESAWDDEYRTVLPSDVTDAALTAYEQYPDKRLIVHYLQPHYPFIGETGLSIDHGSVTGDGVIKDGRDVLTVWEQLKAGSLEVDRVKKAYRENLEIVLPEVKRLLDGIDGKSVVTSDHGNAFGEFEIYGHPGGLYIESLVKVPWLVIPGEIRKSITDDGIQTVESDSSSDVSDRLADLGYLE